MYWFQLEVSQVLLYFMDLGLVYCIYFVVVYHLWLDACDKIGTGLVKRRLIIVSYCLEAIQSKAGGSLF